MEEKDKDEQIKILQNRIEELERGDMNRQDVELKAVLSPIRALWELLPICMYCKKVKDEKKHWQPIENYILKHTKSHCSHGICPDCYKKHIQPDLDRIELEKMELENSK